MSAEENMRLQNTLWWIASIAVSVLCCSVLFILFASYLVDVKAAVHDNNARLTLVEEREDRILAEMDAMRKRDAVAVPAAATAPSTEGQGAMVPAPADTSAPVAAPVATTLPEQAVTPPATPVAAPTVAVPPISPPVLSPPPPSASPPSTPPK